MKIETMTPDEPPEPERFDQFEEVTVNGRSIMRFETLSDFELSDVDTAVMARLLTEAGTAMDDEIKEDHDFDAADIIEKSEPEILIYDSEEGEWSKE
ncbi:hypothetical protein [Halosimplex pelagicum]|uniref:Uncharacterized protein n=1 Tax=Halosimplex pelagicum TaxID=869886 RepID=A0A7D5SXC4_9EURY|nr:hypothetical protein [Halosimplex pelagicum]QLH83787.1 hypothetical protein HZS54_20085 [Halosimplex pelagicum]